MDTLNVNHAAAIDMNQKFPTIVPGGDGTIVVDSTGGMSESIAHGAHGFKDMEIFFEGTPTSTHDASLDLFVSLDGSTWDTVAHTLNTVTNAGGSTTVRKTFLIQDFPFPFFKLEAKSDNALTDWEDVQITIRQFKFSDSAPFG